jgi:hypothetical protein
MEEDPSVVLRQTINKVLLMNESKCLDNEEDRHALLDALTSAMEDFIEEATGYHF